MLRAWLSAPGRPLRGRSGAALFLALALPLAACDADRSGRTVDLEGRTLRLKRGQQVLDVRARVGDAGGEFQADSFAAAAGDIVRFLAADALTHAFAFDAAALAPAGRDFLERTAQLRSPPLVAEGSAWIVTLQGAPAGRYPFTCLVHGGRGALVVKRR